MSIKFDTSEYVEAAQRGIKDYLSTVDAASILGAQEASISQWPIPSKSNSDRDVYEAKLLLLAYVWVYKSALFCLPTPLDAQVNHLRLVTIAQRATAAGLALARAEAGNLSEAEGKMKYKKAYRLMVILEGIERGESVESASRRAGVSRATGFRYLEEHRSAKGK